MKGALETRTTEPAFASLRATHGGYAGIALDAAEVDSDTAQTWRGEYGRIRLLQDRMDEAERLRSAIDRTKKSRTPGYAKLAIRYADVLHRLHRDDEAIAFLDRIDPVLKRYPDMLDDQAALAARLREAIVASH